MMPQIVTERGKTVGVLIIPESVTTSRDASHSHTPAHIIIYRDKEATVIDGEAAFDLSDGSLRRGWSRTAESHARLCDTIRRWREHHGFDPKRTP